GKVIFAARCSVCHGAAGSGGAIGPALRGERNRRTLTAVISIVRDPLPPMPKLYPAQMNAQDVLDVSAFVDSL
ncbi:MAG: cytochrome c, partial [Candidatus Eremiobacteraeota bacterium]|nr:cytochrome c [Candidatus Eremiobacteraeota bacterium]